MTEQQEFDEKFHLYWKEPTSRKHVRMMAAYGRLVRAKNRTAERELADKSDQRVIGE